MMDVTELHEVRRPLDEASHAPGFVYASSEVYRREIETQRAMSSPAYRPGRMSVLEKPLHHYLNGYLDRLFDRHE